VRVETTVGVYAGVQQKANIVRAGENAIDEAGQRTDLLFSVGIPKEIFAVFANGNVGMHAIAVDSDHRLGQKGRGEVHAGRYLAADEFVELDLICGGGVGQHDSAALSLSHSMLRALRKGA
jgi:hypothetical protein